MATSNKTTFFHGLEYKISYKVVICFIYFNLLKVFVFGYNWITFNLNEDLREN